MNHHLCLIALGSNCEASFNLDKARQQLQRHFPFIVWNRELETRPFQMQSNRSLFLNQVGYFCTDYSLDALYALLKATEIAVGREKKDKALEIIKIDIDLLIYDTEIVKPNDLNYAYISQSIKELNYKKVAEEILHTPMPPV